MHRWVVLLALVACEPPARAVDPPAPLWIYAPPATAFPLGGAHGGPRDGATRARIGRSQAPDPGLLGGITGDPALTPLRLPTPWPVPGAGPARAVVYGTEVDHPAVELIDVDAGIVRWRNTTTCTGPIVGVTDEAIVCADAQGVRGLKLDGKTSWKSDTALIAITDERVVVGGAGEAIVLDAASGDELTRIKMPAGIPVESVIASCGDVGRELFATGQDGRLVRITDAKGGPTVAWGVAIGAIAGIDACEGDAVIVTVPGQAGTALIALARATGKQTGRLDGVRGYWPARDRSARLEVSTATEVMRWTRDLAGPPEVLAIPPVGELLGKRGDQRLVRATALTALVLDAAGVRAYLPFAQMGAVLGDRAIVAASWSGTRDETVRRFGLPARPASVRLPRHAGVAVPAELRDLPIVKPLDVAAAIAKPDTGKHAVAAILLAAERDDAPTLFTVPLEREPDDRTSAAVAAFDLAARAWRWQRTDGCGEGTPIALAAARGIVVCGARGSRSASVRATSRDGAPRWFWEGEGLDALEAGGDSVLVHDADRLIVLDAATGHARATITSDDGAAVRAAVLPLDDLTLVVTYERGRVIARYPRVGMVPVWSYAIDGVVKALSTSRDGVLVELEDGDAVRIDARTGELSAMPGLGLVWRASGELVLGQVVGGPIPAPPKPAPPHPPVIVVPRPRLPTAAKDVEAPPMSTPIPPPPPLGDSWQLTLYELTGGLRVRNDYALLGTVLTSSVRGPAGSPLVVSSGDQLHEVLVLDPTTGDPVRRVQLPDDAPPGLVFSTILDGTPIVGAVLASPLRVVLF